MRPICLYSGGNKGSAASQLHFIILRVPLADVVAMQCEGLLESVDASCYRWPTVKIVGNILLPVDEKQHTFHTGFHSVLLINVTKR